MLRTLAARRETDYQEAALAPIPFPLTVTDDHGAVVLKPLGELDMTTGRVLRDAVVRVLSDPPERMVFDLGSLTFLDSCGCNALLIGLRGARTKGVPVELRGDMAPIVRRVVDLTLLASLFDAA